ncbi:Pyrimidine reductase, riboflavin biosynthesis [Corynebacterium mycetoides]|uniref:Pyrimidine reductase, riboflavin biosynthesis n=1 Tax=Corynebacterium mycetoides TaxID=38302 RepID=A0A1G9MQW3_9CORY|nr:dihydrofolate reductase family protein [Corynebacterium mycetoides]SDL76493.1 Pyrimidine reductase, riboflavin biosynthesis [Corynebacterium mycetoides]
MTPSDLIGPTLTADQPEFRMVAVMSLFGALSRAGTSGSMGNDLDARLLAALREWSDCVLVSASTVRAEDYGPASTQFAVLSRTLDFDASARFFAGTPPLILTPQASLTDPALGPARAALEQAGAQLVGTGAGTAAEVVAALHARGLRRISCEGGPKVYSAMLSGDVVDVVHVTVDPSISGSDANYLPPLEARGAMRRFTLESAVSDDSVLFTRYRRVRP